ncbi:MAG TPA: SRPBCC domain-containing protein [Actinomycetota bacterium]|jgi:uncharacterized protein YndB with AHSA1/START domain|nr:SRPBCC domain-containing protein [Actinomycetota bacterium]
MVVRYEITIAAPIQRVYRHLTESAGLTRWMAVTAVADARPGGELRWTHENGATMCGRFVELDPPHRVTFTYGWEDGRLDVPPESSLVEIDLDETEGVTTVRVAHHRLPDETADAHRDGWNYFLEILNELLATDRRTRNQPDGSTAPD